MNGQFPSRLRNLEFRSQNSFTDSSTGIGVTSTNSANEVSTCSVHMVRRPSISPGHSHCGTGQTGHALHRRIRWLHNLVEPILLVRYQFGSSTRFLFPPFLLNLARFCDLCLFQLVTINRPFHVHLMERR